VDDPQVAARSDGCGTASQGRGSDGSCDGSAGGGTNMGEWMDGHERRPGRTVGKSGSSISYSGGFLWDLCCGVVGGAV